MPWRRDACEQRGPIDLAAGSLEPLPQRANAGHEPDTLQAALIATPNARSARVVGRQGGAGCGWLVVRLHDCRITYFRKRF